MNHFRDYPKFSVVIPTRERCDTLHSTLLSATSQSYANCEIIVCDNFSADATHEVVRSFNDKRLRYVNPGKRLAMSENWEFALGHCRGEYVTFLGDDDALMPNALKQVEQLLLHFPAEAVAWRKIDYQWPDYIVKSLQNTALIYLPSNNLERVNPKRKLRSVIGFRDGYTSLPCVYNAFVKLEKILDIKSKSRDGVFFSSISPDVYSGLALSTNIKSFLYTTHPFSLNGASRHSNGTASMLAKNDRTQDESRRNALENKHISYDNRIKIGPSATICVMAEYLRALQNIPGMRQMHGEPNWNRYLRKLVTESIHSPRGNEIEESAAHTAMQINHTLPKCLFGRNQRHFIDSVSTGVCGDLIVFRMPSSVRTAHEAAVVLQGIIGDWIPSGVRSPIMTCIMNFCETLKRGGTQFLKGAYKCLP